MNRIAAYLIALAALAILVAGCTSNEATAPANANTAVAAKAQTNCPVMGGAIDKKVFTDHDGKRIYFCCPDCVGTFKKDPAKYLKNLANAGVTLEKAPEAAAK